MQRNALIREIAYYHPDNIVDNDYYIDHFKQQNKSINGLLHATGRRSRYIATDMNETIVEMGFKAAEKVLKKAYVKPVELDMIVFATGTPEYISPTNALILHERLGAKQKCGVYDLNSSCAGMLVALEQISRCMQSRLDTKYTLLVSADQLNRYSDTNSPITYANFGDAACAVLLESVSNTDRGLVDSDFYTNSAACERILFPAKGMCNVIKNMHISEVERLIQWDDFDLSGAFNSAHISIRDLMFRNNLKKTDIKRYFVSQFSLGNIKNICKDLDEDMDKFVFIGDEYGYTGSTSPLLAYARAVEKHELEVGDNVIFWTVGAGLTCVSMLYRQ